MTEEVTQELLFSSDDTVAYMTTHQIGVHMEAAPGKRPAADPTTGTIKQNTITAGELKVAYWGAGNDFPNIVRQALSKDAEMKELINWCVRAAYGKGIVCLNEIDIDANGVPVYQSIKDRKITDFFRSRQTRLYCIEGFQDLFTFWNVFPELITTRDRSQIASIQINEAYHCRWELMGDDGKLKNVYHNKNWPWIDANDPNQTATIPAIDPYDFDVAAKVKANKNLKKFIYPLNYPSIGQTYYQVANWDALRVSGWLDIAAKIPEFKMALLNNQMTIKYIVRIPNSYWPSVYKDWDKLGEAAQKEKKRAKLKEVNDSLTGARNAGKSILNEVGIDPVTKEKIPGWEIVPIDDKTKPGAFLEDSLEASSHKMRALGINSALPGAIGTASKGMNTGGTDQQLAWNIYIAMIDPYREIILDPLYFKAEFDGIKQKYPGFTLKFRDSIMETVNGHNQTATGGLT